MEGWRLERTRLVGGVWEGRLSGPPGAEPPPLVATWRGEDVGQVRVEPVGDGLWSVAVHLPVAIMSDGVQLLSIGPAGDKPLCIDTFAFGDPLETDLRTELAALRTELEVLGRAFRRHLDQDE